MGVTGTLAVTLGTLLLLGGEGMHGDMGGTWA